MLKIAPKLEAGFDELLDEKKIPVKLRFYYKEWLRYYLDFCNKYHFDKLNKQSLSHFIGKLQDKKQNKQNQKQAVQAVSVYYELEAESTTKTPSQKKDGLSSAKKENRSSIGASWDEIYTKLHGEIKIRHYSPKTLRAYRGWIRQFQNYAKSKDPQALSSSDVKDFLTFLAVKRKVSASSQNQAFNALLFFFRHVIKSEFGEIKDVPRAKKKPYIPVVLSREEIDAIIGALSYPYDLVVKLLYGCP